jgi:uncharacterized surface protein with fasciclin (FAS1) repeats
MRQIRTILALTAVTAVAATGVVAGATADTPRAADKNIVETAVSAGKFKTLASLLKRAGLVKTLQGEGPYTVFAPTDAAFDKVPDATLARLGRDKAALRNVLLLHVAEGRLTAAKLTNRRSAKTLNGQRLRIRVRDGKVFVGGARVVTADVTASNGVIHAINKARHPRSPGARRVARRGCAAPGDARDTGRSSYVLFSSPHLRTGRSRPAAEPGPARARDRRDRIHRRTARAGASRRRLDRPLPRARAIARPRPRAARLRAPRGRRAPPKPSNWRAAASRSPTT